MGRRATQWANAFIAHLAGVHVPTAEARCPTQISGARVLPPEILRGARANVSCWPFLCARQCFLPVWAAYKSGRRSPGHGHQKPSSRRCPPKLSRSPAASHGAHRQHQVDRAQGARSSPLPRGCRGGGRHAPVEELAGQQQDDATTFVAATMAVV
jgi:hypothetical protein